MIAIDEARTIGALRRAAARMLREAFAKQDREGTPELDARLLLAHVLGIGPGEVVLRDREQAPPSVRAELAALIDRRSQGEPVARIIGKKEFWGSDFLLSPETLVPRPETETIVAAALQRISEGGRPAQPLRILDIGTGSGAILLSLLIELPNAQGVGTDRAFGAVVTARKNARRLGLEGRAGFVVGDWAAPISAKFDLIVSNPPYVESRAIPGLPVEVRAHDPHVSLDGGPDGLKAYRAILTDLDRVLGPESTVLLEVGARQADSVEELVVEHGFRANRHADLAGIDRVVEFRPQSRG